MISKRLRYEVLRRDDHACRYCGAKAPDATLTVDHVLPISLGGVDDPSNLVAACAACNAGKSSSAPDSPIVENVADDALRWAAAMEEAAEIERKDKRRRSTIVRAVDKRWLNWTNDAAEPMPRPSDWKATLDQFITQGLSKAELVEAVEITMGAPRVYNQRLWRYFCGVCWNKVRERQDVARALIEAEDE